jgi:cell division protein ZapE
MTKGPLERYRGLVDAREIEPDDAQRHAAERLDALSRALATWRPQRGFLSSLFGRASAQPPRGLYIHGAVGRGKTMLMDLFYASVTFEPKRRVHFHTFMADVHERIAEVRRTVPGDPIPAVARQIADQARLLCFDELHVTDIADAMILGRLFKGLLESEVVVVATSNARPTDLYRNGLNRQLFLPFVDLIEEHMDVLELVSAKDYRLEKLSGQPLYFTPADVAATAEMDRIWTRLTGGQAGKATELEVKGRKVSVPRAAMGIARFTFAELCEKPLGTIDYLQIARTFHTVFIDHIPVLSPQRRNEARRFINLIDTLYDERVGLIVSADAEPDELFIKGDGADLFERTASRLMEMRSETYLADRHSRRAQEALPVT